MKNLNTLNSHCLHAVNAMQQLTWKLHRKPYSEAERGGQRYRESQEGCGWSYAGPARSSCFCLSTIYVHRQGHIISNSLLLV